MTTTLLAVTGLSPAIVTETVWALAKQKPPILPNRVGFITTATGADIIEKQLFTAKPEWDGLCVWEALRQLVKAGPNELIADPVHVISMPELNSGRARALDDIRTPDENKAAAEFIFSRVWDVVRDKDCRLIASVAGGRKTMGALLHAAVSLIGRPDDLLTHVLVNAPFETMPGFFFPKQPGGTLRDRDGNLHDPKSATPMLAEVPFVSLRKRFKDLDDLPGSFLALRESLGTQLSNDAEREIPIRIEHDRRRLHVDGVLYRPTARCLAVLEFVLRSHFKGQTFIGDEKNPQDLAAEAFSKWHAKNAPKFSGFALKSYTARTLTKDLSDLRKLLENAPWKPAKASFVQNPFRLE